MHGAIEWVDVSREELAAVLARAEAALGEQDYQLIKRMLEGYGDLLELLENKTISLRRLRKLLFGSQTERTRDVNKKDKDKDSAAAEPSDDGRPSEAAAEATSGQDGEQKKPSPGHGRHAAKAYWGAEQIGIRHESLKSGDPCPRCQRGKVYENKPKVVVRLTGQAPVQGKVYRLQRLRCNLCGKIFTADAPPDMGDQKYDATVASIIAVLRYGNGMPFNRLERLQGGMGIPLAASTQWDKVNEQSDHIKPAYEQVVREAAQGQVLHNDDTPMKVLALMGPRTDPASGDGAAAERTGIFTTGIISIIGDRQIALFFTGHRHAGENLEQVLSQRATERGPPIQMCDALSRNVPKELEVILGHCLAHGRRQFVDLAEIFPEPVLHVLEILKQVYAVDAKAKAQHLSDDDRLILHQAESGPLMQQLHQWLMQRTADPQVEPNSPLGGAVRYMLKHWVPLTLFLREPGAPLDNNICERGLKMAIRHRRNSLFYLSEHGAEVGDMYMSLIHTCYLNGVDPFDYLTALHRHPEQVAGNPAAWMPWNYPVRASPDAAG
jgi:transposase